MPSLRTEREGIFFAPAFRMYRCRPAPNACFGRDSEMKLTLCRDPSRASRLELLRWWLMPVLCVMACSGCRPSGQPALPSGKTGTEATASRSPSSPTTSPSSLRPVDKGDLDNGREMEETDRETVLAEVRKMVDEEHYSQATARLKALLLSDPNDVEAIFTLASVTYGSGDVDRAIELLGEIPADHAEAGLPALGQSADWCLEAGRFDDAERKYSMLLQRAPHAAQARRQLGYLLNRQGRRQEAAEQIRELCRQGNVREDELYSLVILLHPMYDPPAVTSSPADTASHDQRTNHGRLSDGTDDQADRPYWPIGPEAEARILLGDRRFREAADALQEFVEGESVRPSALALYGRAVAEAQDEGRFHWWLSRADEQTQRYGDYWAAIGAFELGERRFDTAARALGEALDRDFTDYVSMGRLRQAMLTLGDHAVAERLGQRWYDTRKTNQASARISSGDSGKSDPEAIDELASMLVHLNRPLEAVLWKYIEGLYLGVEQSQLMRLNAERERLVNADSGFPTQQQRLCGMILSDYPLPKLDARKKIEAPSFEPTPEPDEFVAARFENLADAIGLNHTYAVASTPQTQRYSIYQTLGGGVAVFDYDLDGFADLYFAQGGADPPSFQSEVTNQLFRNARPQLVDVTRQSHCDEYQYSIGVTAGDWNQDGFPDLVVANIGSDTLLTNNGDGTFTQTSLGQKSFTRVPSSPSIADVTGDALPDIFQTVYIDDPELNTKPPIDDAGRVTAAVSPGDFDAGGDWLMTNNRKGGFTAERISDQGGDVFPGLGVLVTNFDDRPGNEIFVGNDLFPNQLWMRDSETGSWSDVASPLGCAFGYTGLATGSMGIAVGDFDLTGTLDIHITNYERQNASLFLGAGGAFRDRNVQYDFTRSSHSMVGFGTQAIDYDNNGRIDLVITNGHLDDSLANVTAFKQPPQLLRNMSGRFALVDVEDQSGYWSEDYLGRGLARLDYNRDGKNDFVVSHIGDPSALLLNQTPTNNRWIQFQLVGTISEREGIGAKVRVRFADQERTEWMTSGDGYLSRNESVVSFGLGTNELVDEVLVLWPSGMQQVLQNVRAGARWLVVEGQMDLHELDAGLF